MTREALASSAGSNSPDPNSPSPSPTNQNPTGPNPTGPGATGTTRHAVAFWLVAFSFLTLMSFTTVPTPLYPLYQATEGFPAFMITVIFAAYGFGVIAGLFLVGHLSDHYGRRRMVLIAVAVEVFSALLFTLSTAVGVWLIARFICGFGIGMLTAAATAHLAELQAVARPRRGSRFASTVATVVNSGGLAIGPLAGGLLTEWWPNPLRLPFVVYLVALVLVGVVVATVPETVDRPAERVAYRPQRVRVEPSGRGEFISVAIGAAAAFSVLGLFTSLAATVLHQVMHHESRLLAGAVVFAMLGASALSQVVFVRFGLHTRLRLGRALMVIGLIALAVSAITAWLALFAISGVLAGAGVGLVFQAAIGTAARLAPAGAQAETISGMFLAAYLGITVPVIAVGVTLTLVGRPVPVLVGFAVVVIGVVSLAVGRTLRGLPSA